MTVAELITELQKHPPELEVEFEDARYGTSEVNSVEITERNYDEIPFNRPAKMQFVLVK